MADTATLTGVSACPSAGAPAGDPGSAHFFAPECPSEVPMAGHSPALRETLGLIRLVAQSGASPVLILGETGTGKELAAQAIHVLRGGQSDQFIAVNCATLTANLLESELFGHVKGAFTGADREKTGLFELAGSGSIFLDEISEMPSSLQAKLLRVLQERKFRKVGGTRDIASQATVIASSNRDLAAECRAGSFRHDLYYRLAVLPIVMPPLRAPGRRQDVPLLAEFFLAGLASARGGLARTFSRESRELLLAHSWPGNVRELRNVVERALILEQGPEITPASLRLEVASAPEAAGAPPAEHADDFSLETAERIFITRALQETGWQRTRAAALLGITRATLHAKLKRYRITFPESGGSPLDDQDDAPPASLPADSRLGEARLKTVPAA
jgi:transcriptional regulator with GAF, ATPase, and Fis domain